MTQNSITIQELSEKSGLPFEYVCSCLKALIDVKFLKTEESSREAYTPYSLIDVNLRFKPMRPRFHLQPPSWNSRTQEIVPMPSQKETVQDRKVAVECSIVRALKARKVMKHEDLVQFVVSSVRNRFVPEIAFLKTCIEGLIDRHFIQRTGAIDEYEYLA